MSASKRAGAAWAFAGLGIVLVGGGAFLLPGLLRSSGPRETPATSAATRTPPPFDDPNDPLAMPEPEAGAETFGLRRFGIETPPAKRPGTIRLATYNIENMFDGVDDPVSPANDVEWEKPEAEMRAVAEAIRLLDADVLALQEVESESVLRAFRDEYLSDMGYAYLVSKDAGDRRGIEQSVLSRFPVVASRVWDNFDTGEVHPELWQDQPNRYAGQPITLRRSPLMAMVEIPGAPGAEAYRLTMFVVHHKSGRGNDYWREAEARGVIRLIEQETDAGENVVVLGDFNARPEDASVRLYAEAGLREAWTNRPRGPEGRTHASGRAIDLMLFNDAADDEIVPGSFFVLGTVARPEGVDWRNYAPPPGYASDHYPVAVDLTPIDR